MKHIAGKLPRKGEMVIMKDFPESTDWYLAEIAKVLNDRFVVNGYITEGAPLANYKAKSWRARKANLEKFDIPSHLVCQSRQRKGNDHPSSASQGAAGLLMEMENSHC